VFSESNNVAAHDGERFIWRINLKCQDDKNQMELMLFMLWHLKYFWPNFLMSKWWDF